MAAPTRVDPVPSPATPGPVTPDPVASPTRPSRGRRLLRGLALGVAAAAIVVLGRLSGLLLGGGGLVVVGLVLAVPTARELSRRVLLAGCLTLGWVPLLWWVPLPVGDVGRVTIAAAVLAGGLAGWVGAGARPGRRARRLLPRVRGVDLLIPLSVGFGVLMLHPWLQDRSPIRTLGLLMTGWDNSAHFSMVHMIRRFGVTVDALTPPPGGATWQFGSYPEGFHAVVATIIETMRGPVPGDIGTELSAYSHAVALILILAVAMLVAGFCALPVLRARPAVAGPVTAFVASVFYLGPGATAIQGGFGNFTVACTLVVAIALVGVTTPRVPAPLSLAAIGGAVVGVATGWVLLTALAVPAVLVVLFPWRRRRWVASRGQVLVSAVVVLAVAGALVRTGAVVARVQSGNPLALTGGIVPPELGPAAASALAVLGAATVVARRRARGPRARVAVLALVPVVAVAVTVALAVVQVRAHGVVTYYGFKFITGAEIVLLVLLMIPVAHLLADRRRRRPSVPAVAGSVVLMLAATQVFGLATPDLTGIGLAPKAPGAANLVRQDRALAQPAVTTADLADRVGAQGAPTPHTYYLDVPSDRRIDSILAAQWYLALTDTWTSEANDVAVRISVTGPVGDAAGVARRVLLSEPDAVVLVRPFYVETLRRDLRNPDLAARVAGL